MRIPSRTPTSGASWRWRASSLDVRRVAIVAADLTARGDSDGRLGSGRPGVRAGRRPRRDRARQHRHGDRVAAVHRPRRPALQARIRRDRRGQHRARRQRRRLRRGRSERRLPGGARRLPPLAGDRQRDHRRRRAAGDHLHRRPDHRPGRAPRARGGAHRPRPARDGGAHRDARRDRIAGDHSRRDARGAADARRAACR